MKTNKLCHIWGISLNELQDQAPAKLNLHTEAPADVDSLLYLLQAGLARSLVQDKTAFNIALVANVFLRDIIKVWTPSSGPKARIKDKNPSAL